jgi:hypothetical protein
MATLPVRTLGQIGLVADTSPYDLPLNAFSKAINVLFDEGRVQRCPVFKPLYSAFRSSMPYSDYVTAPNESPTATFENTVGGITSAQRFLGSYSTADAESVLVADCDGEVREYLNGVLKIVSGYPAVVVNSDAPWSHAQAAGVSVLARRGMRPYARNLATEATYGELRGDWNATHSCAVIRSYNDFLLALNVTKGSQRFPTMVKWCHPLQYSPDLNTGIVWATDDPTKLSGENPIGEMKTPIRDGVALGRSFIIYSQDQVWAMDFTGGTDVFNFRKIFSTGGIIGTNCALEVEAKHFVFGEDDLYTHDGMSIRSVADEKVRKKVFKDMDRNKRDSFFVHHDSTLNLIYFCYVTKDTDASYPGTAYCNMAAVFNYRNSTWSFMDLPNICGAAETNISLEQAGFPSASSTLTPRVSVMLGVTDSANSLTESRVYAVDLPDVGIVKIAPHPETIKRALVERTGIEFDKEANFEIRSYKTIKAIVPQVLFAGSTGKLEFTLGASDFIDGPVYWQEPQTFDHTNQYKVDTRASGRYLAVRATSGTADFFRWLGYDIETIKTAKR